MATSTIEAPTIVCGETVTEGDLVFTAADRARMASELESVPAIQQLKAALAIQHLAA